MGQEKIFNKIKVPALVIVPVMLVGMIAVSGVNSATTTNELENELEGQEQCMCTMEYAPVCGEDGETYSNSCRAECAGVGIAYKGECEEKSQNNGTCETDEVCEWVSVNCCSANAGAQWECVNRETTEIDCPNEPQACPQVISPRPEEDCVCAEDGACTPEGEAMTKEEKEEKKNRGEMMARIQNRAQKLFQGDAESIVQEMEGQVEDTGKAVQGLQTAQEKISQARERAQKHLGDMKQKMEQMNEQSRKAVETFVGYGVDKNTKKLGAGERAAVIHSYQEAFNKLPGNEKELEDAIRIANGRWPSEISEKAEEEAKDTFRQIYDRTPNMENPQDNAAVTVMAYGLRQRAENRNMESEEKGIQIFENIYGHAPQNTEEWNIMQAITYSGAKK